MTEDSFFEPDEDPHASPPNKREYKRECISPLLKKTIAAEQGYGQGRGPRAGSSQAVEGRPRQGAGRRRRAAEKPEEEEAAAGANEPGAVGENGQQQRRQAEEQQHSHRPKQNDA